MGCITIPRGIKICLIVTAILIAILAVVVLVLSLTILKPKQPKITTQSVTLEYIKWVPIPFHMNVTLGIVVSVDNPNYGSFKYDNSTAYITYRGVAAADAPIEHDTIPARGSHEISTTVVLIVDSLTSSPYFLGDFISGCLNFTSSTTLHGKATVFKIFKKKVTTYSTCDLSVYIQAQNVTSVCHSKIKY
ncbi:Late embryogenesis abundant (LEA) hydroxyproline-rich glycoprotein family [Forsythia ovata]|uniref:Late embryogenesis abundant (LEA) hydroxyproline-rich glycoprotein family n=1 Tax=Forsythia ovata TaxID=205694 RepID=A0ABD1R7D1_9LAMI